MDPDVLANTKAIREYEMATGQEERFPSDAAMEERALELLVKQYGRCCFELGGWAAYDDSDGGYRTAKTDRENAYAELTAAISQLIVERDAARAEADAAVPTTNRQEWSERVERLFQPLEWVQGWDGAIVPDEKLLNIHGLLETLHDPNEPITQDERDDLYAALEALIALRSRVSLLEREIDERGKYAESIRRERDTLRAQLFADNEARKRAEAELAELRTKYEEADRDRERYAKMLEKILPPVLAIKEAAPQIRELIAAEIERIDALKELERNDERAEDERD